MRGTIARMSVLVCLALVGKAQLAAAEGDQCKTVTVAMANKVTSILPTGSSFLWYCQPCGEKHPSAWGTLGELAVLGSGNSARQIKINDRVTDLAYVYYRTAMGTARNLGIAVGCAARGVSDVLTFPPTVAKARYTLTIRIQIAPKDADGNAWDETDNSPPDPVFTLMLYQGEQEVAKLPCPSQRDTYVATCVVTVDADDQSAIAGSVRDHDPINDDDVGTIATSLEQAVKNPNRAVPVLGSTGQILAATVTLSR